MCLTLEKSSQILADHRWIGAHGIGRFASEVIGRCKFGEIGLNGKPLGIKDPFRLTAYLRKIKPAHFFSPGFNAPLGRPCPFSLTIHDLIHLDISEELSASKRLYYKHVIMPAVKNADLVFTVSEFSRGRIVEWANVSDDRVICVGNGVAPTFSPDGDRYESDRPYVLYVGNQKPHKNLKRLLQAFAKSSLRESHDLLLTGSMYRELKGQVEELHMVRNVQAIGLVPENLLPEIYRGASAVVMPSYYEGFGLPVVESMASGTPVLCSNVTSLPEVGGNAVRYFDPYDVDQIVAALDAVLDVDEMSRLRVAGLDRAMLFDWRSVAAKVLSAISNTQ